jgi:threonine/homoserine/homoserine lactone efflux protein
MTGFLAEVPPAAMLGLFVAIPFGPVCLMCVQRTLASGIRFGVASGMGAAVAHGTFSFMAVVSAAALADTARTAQLPLGIAGGLVLVFMGVRACLAPTHPVRDARCEHLCSAFLSTLLIAATNPMTMLPYLAIAAEPQAASPLSMSRGFAAPIGVMVGSASWYLAVALAAKAMFQNLQRPTLDRLNMLAGVLLIGLGATLFWRTI